MAHGISFCPVCGQRSPYHWSNCPNNNYTGAETNTMAVGWLCPRCSRVNAPDVKKCRCKSDWKEALRKRGINPNSTGQPPFEIGEGSTDGIPIKYQVWS